MPRVRKNLIGRSFFHKSGEWQHYLQSQPLASGNSGEKVKKERHITQQEMGNSGNSENSGSIGNGKGNAQIRLQEGTLIIHLIKYDTE